MNTAIQLDTYRAITILKKSGMDAKQSEAVVDVLSSSNLNTDNVASSHEVRSIDRRMIAVETKIDNIQRINIAIFVTVIAGFALQMFN